PDWVRHRASSADGGRGRAAVRRRGLAERAAYVRVGVGQVLGDRRVDRRRARVGQEDPAPDALAGDPGSAPETGSPGPAGDRLVHRDRVAVERHDDAGTGEQAAPFAIAAGAAAAVESTGAAQAADSGVAGKRAPDDADGSGGRRARHKDPAAQAVAGEAAGPEVAAEAAGAADGDVATDHRRGDGEIPCRVDGATKGRAADP